MIRKFLFTTFLALIICSCGRKLYYSREYKDWNKKAVPEEETVYSVYLLGDVGYPFNKEESFKQLSSMIEKDTISATVILGDNIYHDGMPPEDHPDRERAEKRMGRVLQTFDNYQGRVFVVPGNHDWDYQGDEGWSKVLLQEEFVEKRLNSGNTFVPDNACPGPLKVSVSDELVMIFLDTQWWLHEHDKPYGSASECEAATPGDILIRLRDIIERNEDRHIVVAGHHPLYSNGNHGGYYNALDHLFPLRLIANKWYMYMPLPGLGSLYPLYRKFGGSEQDLPSYEYQILKDELMKIFKEYKDVIYVSGHEHNLQYFNIDDFHHIVSGSSCKLTPVRKGGEADYVQKDYGFAKLNFYSNGEAWVEYYNTTEDDSARLAFRTELYKKFEISPESYCTLSRKDYSDSSVVVEASEQYKASKFKQLVLGDHYRKSWSTPIEVPVLDLQTEKGGIIPYGIGGGKQSLSLKFKNPEGQEYVARTIQKDPKLGEMLNLNLDNTVVDDLVQDQISAQHPYAAVTIPPMSRALGILHPNPKIAYIPADSCLGPYYDEFANTLIMFEEDPDESHTDAPNLGYSEEIVGTDKLKQELREDSDNEVDQQAFAKSRLFDMLIGDWDRHDGQYRWAEFEKDGKGDIYIPVAEDRDQVYFKFDGLLPFVASRRWGARMLRDFDESFSDIKGLNLASKEIDRRFLSELTRQDWIAIADTIQQELTDEVIENGLKELPPKVYELNGPDIAETLKARRGRLKEVAEEYYELLAKYVDVYGSNKHELFIVERLNDDETSVTVYKTKKEGDVKKVLYDRVLKEDETKEIRLYGMGGLDEFRISGKVDDGIVVRVIGGDGTDTIIDRSKVAGLKDHTVVYDRESGNYINQNKEIKYRLSDDPDINDINRDKFAYNYAGPTLSFTYNRGDGLFLGTGIVLKRYKFRSQPYGAKHKLVGSYASATHSFRVNYVGDFRKVLGKNDFSLVADLWLPYFAMNFFGYGNDSPERIQNIDYYRVRMKYGFAYPALVRRFTSFLEAGIGPKFTYYDLVRRSESSSSDFAGPEANYFEPQYFGGIEGYFKLGNSDNKVNPTRGLMLTGKGSANQELNFDNSFYTHFESEFTFYATPNLPFQLTIAGRIGGALNTGDFTFYQANYIGGLSTVRGYYRTRFVGDRSFYQNLELRSQLLKAQGYWFAGKIGIAGFIDNGRVWPGGGGYHQGYGGGIWASVIDRFVISSYYGISEESNRVILNLGFFY